MAVFKLSPSYVDYVWGGSRLITDYHKKAPGSTLGESWELSCHPDGKSTIATGEFCGKTLAQWIAESGKEVLGTACRQFSEFPILIKFIDAQKDLAIQVHPGDDYARIHENQLGKTEMWYILDCKPGAYVYYGFKAPVTKEQYEAAIRDNTLCDLLNRVAVKKGDSFFIQAGTIHAINAGILVAEVQQSSNVTYRVYDYDYTDANGQKRPLHTAKACDVTTLSTAKTDYNFGPHLADCDYFTVDKLLVEGSRQLCADSRSFHSLLILEGSATLSAGATTLDATKGDSIFLSAGSGDYTLTGSCQALLTYVREPGPRYRVGIDLGGTNIKVGVVDSQNRIIARHSAKTGAQRPWQEVAADICDSVRAALTAARLTLEDCSFVGMGCPGIIDPVSGTTVYSGNLNWSEVPIGKALSQELGLPVQVSNDGNCAALGEFVAGAAKDYSSSVLITLGTGVGGGVVIDGKLFEGGGPGAIELGHTLLRAGGEPCTCGRRGCFEAYSSATALIRDAKRAALAHPESLLNRLCSGDLDNMNGKIPFDAAQAGDSAAQEVIDSYLYWLGEGLVNMVSIFRPQVLILSGGICNQGEALTAPLTDYVAQHTFGKDHMSVPPVVRALLGNDAGIIGAASLGQ